ncbi:MAG: hypothetical protein HOQ45_12140 [Nocardioidaceae bacterium]|nr:hypothetical protein [Nocardioidaceae bacterium]
MTHAHLRCISRDEDHAGTLLLTTEQLIWRVTDPGFPDAAGFAVPLTDVKGVDDVGSASSGAFSLGLLLDGHLDAVLFLPQRPDDAESVSAASQMRAAIEGARSAWS